MTELWKRIMATNEGIFFTCFLQVIIVTINTYQIANHKYLGMAIMGFFISFLWSLNVTAIVFGTLKQRIIYGLGGACGCIVGGVITHFMY